MSNENEKLLESTKRLAILSALKGADMVSFRTIAQTLELSDPDLSRELRYLKLAGFVATRKVGRSTWVNITGAGEDAYAAQSQLLRRLLDSN